ncbi:MAG TPA: DUF402 domain-containing protein, partial [Bacilli bacterium]|nr:DUF402 domain-containing protein [Bacilli bacterium]
YVIDQEGLKYIDYDLDVKVFPDGEVLLLDRDEYDFNTKVMQYPEEIKGIIKENLTKLMEFIENKKDPFNRACVNGWYELFMKTTQEKN